MLNAFSALSNSGGGKLIAPYTILLAIWMCERKKFVYYCLLVSVTVFFIITMKMLYKEDRPVW